MNKYLLTIALALCTIYVVSAQDAAAISQLLNKETATYMDFSYLVASELGMEVSKFEAYAFCDRYGVFPFSHSADTPIKVKTISHFLMKNYGLSGGLMWRATGNARYAWKELRANRFWSSQMDPEMYLSGRDLVRAFSKFISQFPNAKLIDPPGDEAPARFRNALLAGKEESL